MSTIAATNLKNPGSGSNNVVLNADGSIGGTCLTQTCRAWVNFNGTGTVAIRASYNVSSITDNNVGDYTVNFTTPMPDENYSLCGSAQFNGSSGNGNGNTVVTLNRVPANALSNSAARICTVAVVDTANVVDCLQVCVSVFR
jgi:hypothetical protein